MRVVALSLRHPASAGAPAPEILWFSTFGPVRRFARAARRAAYSSTSLRIASLCSSSVEVLHHAGETPLPLDDLDGIAKLSAESPVKIAFGEMVQTSAPLFPLYWI